MKKSPNVLIKSGKTKVSLTDMTWKTGSRHNAS